MPRRLPALFLPFMMSILLYGCSFGTFLKPHDAFEPPQTPSPNYQKLSNWAAHPHKQDKSSFTPPGLAPSSRPKAAVFFVHPTAWFSRTVWNAHFEAGPAREIVDDISMASQASAFNACCEIYAPRYRQTTLGAFYAEHTDAQASFELAYHDIQRAFQVFLDHYPQGPIVLAGHSQGSMHLMRLLENIEQDPTLRKRITAAYLPGMALPLSWYKTRYQHWQACSSPSQTQCIAAWDTYRQGAGTTGHDPLYYWQGSKLVRVPSEAPRQCTNPISWTMDEQATALSAHHGAVEMRNEGKDFSFLGLLFSDAPLEIEITGLKAPRAQLVSAQCQNGFLRVPDLKALNYPAMETEPGNYHLLDYELFWMDIRNNLTQRLENFSSGAPAAHL